MTLGTVISIWAPQNRRRVFMAAAVLTVAISALDWWTESYVAFGFLYLFPVILLSGFISRIQITIFAASLAVLAELFAQLPPAAAVPRLLFSYAGLLGTGFFVKELVHNRDMAERHVRELTAEAALRREAENETQRIIESTPAAIVTVDHEGKILLANEAADRLFVSGDLTVVGSSIQEYVPSLVAALKRNQAQSFRTVVQCRGQRNNGEAFLAGVWFSTYKAAEGMRLAAIIVDLSDDVRNREDLSLEYLLRNTRILMSAFAHEIRNMCAASVLLHRNLARVDALRCNPDFEALGSLIKGLERLSAMELRDESASPLESVDLTVVLDELRFLLDSVYHAGDIDVQWDIAAELPAIIGDRYALLQVFLNLVKNSMRAMRETIEKKLTFRTSVNDNEVRVYLEDTGTGMENTTNLFQPFQPSAQHSGLGLFVSRALMRSFGGDLCYEPRTPGCAFVVKMRAVPVNENKEAAHA